MGMSGRSSSSSSSLSMRFLIATFIVFSLSPQTICNAAEQKCTPSSCGHIRNISYPFRLKGDPRHCGNSGYTLSCKNNKTILNIRLSGDYYVQAINYHNQTIRVVDPGLEKSNCSSLPLHSLALSSGYNYPDSFYYGIPTLTNCTASSTYSSAICTEIGTTDLTFLKCPSPMNSSLYVDAAPCFPVESTSTSSSSMSSSQPKSYGYVKIGYLEVGQMKDGCSIERITCASWFDVYNASYKSIHNYLVYGIEYGYAHSYKSIRHSSVSLTRKLVAAGTTLGTFVVLLVLLVVAAYCVNRSNRKEKESQLKIETFLEDYKAQKPSRYSYADIKRITNQFQDKLGQGAYGTVFKGKLSSECFVAVKVLNSSNENGEDFIKEVGMMECIHHVNVVRLVGFCADGFNRALVYEFFANGSLHDFISSADNNNRFLGWDKLQDIALAVAQGIYYLHQECDQQILHFDIKPQNVLLDDNFTPKISDFGLAKLCSKDQSIVSMTTARGTMGYIAPEVFSRNFGNVSYKSDVYSFGMLLLEMVGGRKNIDSTSAIPTEIYYPVWIYNLLEGDDLRIHLGEEGDGETPKKLAIVGLWCIQWHPAGRPSMKEVVQMLEGGENLTMPPNPFASTGPARTNATTRARNLNIQLEAIAEIE